MQLYRAARLLVLLLIAEGVATAVNGSYGEQTRVKHTKVFFLMRVTPSAVER